MKCVRRVNMKRGNPGRIVLVTCSTLREARRIARTVVSKRLAACVNIILSPAESFYTWNGKLERAREYLLLMKTAAKRLSEQGSEAASQLRRAGVHRAQSYRGFSQLSCVVEQQRCETAQIIYASSSSESYLVNTARNAAGVRSFIP